MRAPRGAVISARMRANFAGARGPTRARSQSALARFLLSVKLARGLLTSQIGTGVASEKDRMLARSMLDKTWHKTSFIAALHASYTRMAR